MLAWAKANPGNTQDYVCGLIAATADAVLWAMRHRRAGGWIFVQENFIRAVLAIRDMNVARGTAYTDRDLEERFPVAWSKMADAVETCARGVPRPCAGVRRIPRDVLGYPAETLGFGWSRPIRGEALQGLFDYCLETAKAALTSPTDRETVEDWYKNGVFDDREENRRTLARIEAGQGETHRRLLTTEEKILAAIADTKAEVKANGGKIDAQQAKVNETQAAANLAAKNSAAAKRTAENIAQDMAGLPAAIAEAKAEAAGAKVAAEGAQASASFLVHDRMGKQAANRKRGKESHEKAVRDDAERQRANRDLKTALKRVADDPDVKDGKHGAVIAACRRVCKQFTPLKGAKKNAPLYLQLTQADGTPLKPETLARYFREQYGTKRARKSKLGAD